jgi:hypothetical protein
MLLDVAVSLSGDTACLRHAALCGHEVDQGILVSGEGPDQDVGWHMKRL